jgi:hypothetical protein
MATVERVIEAPPDAVAAVLADARRYDGFVVGSKRIRWFDVRWPEPGTRFHHSVGFAVLRIRDHTTVVQDELPDRLLLATGMGPMGRAEVDFTLTPADGSTRVEMREEPVSGPIKAVSSPLLAAAMRARNARALRRLEKLARARAAVRAMSSHSRSRTGPRRCRLSCGTGPPVCHEHVTASRARKSTRSVPSDTMSVTSTETVALGRSPPAAVRLR